MKNSLIACITLGMLLTFGTGCSPSSSSSSSKNSTDLPAAAVLTIDQVLAQADSLAGRTVTLAGVCTHTCKHGATKIFLMGSNDTQTLRIEAGPLGSFDPKCLHSRVQVTGTLKEERIDEGYLLRWEEKQKVEAEKEHTENGGCATEKNARGETAQTAEQRIADFRRRITQRQATEGKAYLSFYFLEATAYEIR